MKARTFFYLSAGALMLAAAYQLGASRANAQAGGLVAGVAYAQYWENQHYLLVVTQAGDVYAAPEHTSPGPGSNPWIYISNVFGGPTTSVPETPASTLSNVKEKYRED
jgi:hypothetical protein